MRAVLLVELRRALERIRLLAKRIARRRTGSRQRAGGGIALRLAAHRTLAANVECLDRVELARVRNAHAHPELLLHARIRHSRLHTAVLERRPLIFVEVGQEGRRRHGLRRERERLAAAHDSLRSLDGLSIRCHERSTGSVERLDAIDVRLNDALTGDLPSWIAFCVLEIVASSTSNVPCADASPDASSNSTLPTIAFTETVVALMRSVT